ncbi:MAG TPA: DUF2304 domain-containing protein [Elusimicrobiota bacterium]|nr:DUF2304 domain-containing protein [Elusimicrobiota bacterium]
MIYRIIGLTILFYFFIHWIQLFRRKRVTVAHFLAFESVLLSIIIVFIFPDVSSFFARQMGITRGADFAVYTLVLFLLLLTFSLVRSNRDGRESLQRLVRELAIREARNLDKID